MRKNLTSGLIITGFPFVKVQNPSGKKREWRLKKFRQTDPSKGTKRFLNIQGIFARQQFYNFLNSTTLKCQMKFGAYIPDHNGTGSLPVLIYLSGT